MGFQDARSRRGNGQIGMAGLHTGSVGIHVGSIRQKRVEFLHANFESLAGVTRWSGEHLW